jgi:hypothetical protein
MNSATVNMGMQVSLLLCPDLHSLGYMPRSGVTDHMVALLLVFEALPY